MANKTHPLVNNNNFVFVFVCEYECEGGAGSSLERLPGIFLYG